MFSNATFVLAAVCMAAAIAYILAEWRHWRSLRWAAKMLASSAFVAMAVTGGAFGSAYGDLILLALVFCWLGDMLLLSRSKTFLLAGIAAFLVAHVVFASAFFTRPLEFRWFLIAFLTASIFGFAVMLWLWKHLENFYRVAVPCYLAAIVVMMSLAAASGSPLVAFAAVVFAVSDVSVARDRFVGRSIVNKFWGIPLYYAAQIMLALSVLLYY